MSVDTSDLLEVASRLALVFKNNSAGSLPEYTRATKLAPIVLIDKRVLAADAHQVNALLQTLLSVYSGYYLTAVNMTMTVGNAEVMRVLDQFSTNRSLLGSAADMRLFSSHSKIMGNEAIDDTVAFLPTYGLEARVQSTSFTRDTSSTAMKDKTGAVSTTTNITTRETTDHKAAPLWDNDKTIHTITDESNLVVGKLLDVKLVAGEQTVTVPVMVTLNPKSIEANEFLDTVRYSAVDRTARGRYHQWRSGEISFIKDYLLCHDLLTMDKRAILADRTGTLLSTRSSQTKSTLATLLSGYGSPNHISAMIIISKQTAADVELIIKGNLKNFHVREKFFGSNVAMMLVVVDLRMERFIMYLRGIEDYSEYTLDDIKSNGSKPNGVDLNSVIKAYNLGNAPSL